VKSPNSLSGNTSLFNLRYLDASHCANATPGGLVEALKHLPALLYLDLSSVQAVRVPGVLLAISKLPSLQILKLRDLALKDDDVELLAGLGKKLRSLDLTNNNLTDRSVRTLLNCCFRRGRAQGVSSSLAPHLNEPTSDDLEDFLEQYQGQQLDRRVRSKLTSALVDSLAIELEIDPGIMHLYLAGNSLTVEGSASVLRSGRMQVLDVGNMNASTQAYVLAPELLSVSKLIPAVNDGVSSELSYFRVDYTIATLEYQPLTDLSTRAELPGEAVGSREHPSGQVFEADGQPIYRPLEEPRFIAELEGSPVQSRVDYPQSDSLTRRGSWEAPESISSLLPGLILASSELPVVPSSASPGLKAEPYQNVSDVPEFPCKSGGIDSSPFNSPAITLIPPPSLKILHLTSVPSTVPTKLEIDKLINLIYTCAGAAHQASLRASEAYELPPGTSSYGAASARRHYAKSLFGLEKIVLEMAPPPEIRKARNGWRTQTRLDAMEDADVDALRKSALQDFSFFDGEEECGLPQNAHLGPAASHYQMTGARSMNDRVLQKTAVPAIRRQYAAELPAESPSSFFNVTASAEQDKFVVTDTGTRNTPSSSRYSAVAESHSGLEVVTNVAPAVSPDSSRTVPRINGQQESHNTTTHPQSHSDRSAYVNAPQSSTPASATGFDVVAHISAFRRDRKAAYEAAATAATAALSSSGSGDDKSRHDSILAEIFVPGYWPGEIQVVR